MIEIVLLIAVGTIALGVLIVLGIAVYRGDQEIVKAIGARTLILCILAVAVAVMVVSNMFGWLLRFVPDTEWWDGATTMGVIIAVVGIAISAINIVQTAVGSWTTDPAPSPADHTALAIAGLTDANERLSGIVRLAVAGESEPEAPGD